MNGERESRMDSVAIMVEYNWIYLHHLYAAVCKRLGSGAVDTLRAGLRDYGRYRGESIRSSAKGCAQPPSALALMHAWDTAELALVSPDGVLQSEGNHTQLVMNFQMIPGSDYFKGKNTSEILSLYWSELLAGVTEGYDDTVQITCGSLQDLDVGPWQIHIASPNAQANDALPGTVDDFSEPVTAIEQSRRSAGTFSAMCMYTGRALIEKYGATGEEVTREALYNFGFERATGMREQAEREGKPLDFQTWFDIMQQRDPKSSAWVFRGDTHISPGVFQVTCTYCPMARAWSEEGAAGLGFGYLYDTEVHRGLVEGFNPKGLVAWEKLKTRGDKVCNFRFSIPALIGDTDPAWAQALKD